VVVCYLLWECAFRLDRIARRRIFAILFLCSLNPIFWGLFEQAGSSLNLYTDRHVDRVVLGREIPASVFQSVNSFFIITCAPLVAWLWTLLGKRGWEPSAPAKFGICLLLTGLGFFCLVGGAGLSAASALTPVVFVLGMYLLHTLAELCLSPVGLSAMSKLSPARMVSLIMGAWFLSTAAGNLIAGMIAASAGSAEGGEASADAILAVYTNVGVIGMAVGIAVLLLAPFVQRLMHLDTLKDEPVA
jgi:proton-dependent oligopeptide transporter, POT family